MTETVTYWTINTQSSNTLKFRIDEINEMKEEQWVIDSVNILQCLIKTLLVLSALLLPQWQILLLVHLSE